MSFRALTTFFCLAALLAICPASAQVPDYVAQDVSHIGGWVNHATVSGDYALLAQGNSIGVFDLTAPDLAKLIAFPLEHEVQQIHIQGQTGILRVNDPDSSLLFMDMNNFENPEIRGAVAVPANWAGKMHACDRYTAYSSSDSLRIVDYTDVSNPQIVHKSATVSNALFCTDTHLFVGNDSLVIFDMSEPDNPQRIVTIKTGYAGALTVQGNLAFVGVQDHVDDFFGVKIFDVTDKSNPIELGAYPTKIVDGAATMHMNPKFICIQNNKMYVAAVGMGAKIFAADISDLQNPVELGHFAIASGYSDVKSMHVDSTHAYLTAGQGSTVFIKIDISDPQNMRRLAEIQAPRIIKHVAAKKNVLFVASMDNFFAYQFKTPTRPKLLATAPQFANMQYIATRLDYTLGIRNDSLFVINTQSPETVGLAAQLVFPNYELLKIALRDSTQAYVITWDDAADSRLIAIDISDPENPQVQSDIAIPGQGRDVFAPNNSNKVFVAYYKNENDRGFQVYDMSNPQNPQPIAGARTQYVPTAVCGTDSTLFVASNKLPESVALMKSNPQHMGGVEPDSSMIGSYHFDAQDNAVHDNSLQFWGFLWAMHLYGEYLMASSPLRYCQ